MIFSRRGKTLSLYRAQSWHKFCHRGEQIVDHQVELTATRFVLDIDRFLALSYTALPLSRPREMTGHTANGRQSIDCAW